MSKFQDFQGPLHKFQDFAGLESKFANLMTFQVFKDLREPCITSILIFLIFIRQITIYVPSTISRTVKQNSAKCIYNMHHVYSKLSMPITNYIMPKKYTTSNLDNAYCIYNNLDFP